MWAQCAPTLLTLSLSLPPLIFFCPSCAREEVCGGGVVGGVVVVVVAWPPSSLARSRCPGFNSHSALFSHHGRSASCRVRSTLLCCILRSPTDRQATMRRRCDDDKRGARIIELPAIPSLPPPLSIEISRNKGIPAIAAKNIPQTDRLRSLAPVSAVCRSAQRSLHLFLFLPDKKRCSMVF